MFNFDGVPQLLVQRILVVTIVDVLIEVLGIEQFSIVRVRQIEQLCNRLVVNVIVGIRLLLRVVGDYSRLLFLGEVSVLLCLLST